MASVEYIINLRDRISTKLSRIQRRLNSLDGAVRGTSRNFTMFQAVLTGIAVKSFFDLGAGLESTKLQFEVLSRSVEKGNKLFAGIQEFANTTPFTNEGLERNARTLLAFGVESENVTKTLRLLGDVSAGDQERLNALVLAFGQVRSAGRLTGQDLLQFINAGFNPLQEISERTGVSIRDLRDQMSKGAISAKLVEEAFQSATGPGGRFHRLTERMADTMAGRFSTAMGKGRALVARLSLSLKDVFSPFLEGAVRAIDFTSKHEKAVSSLLKAIIAFGTAVAVSRIGLIAYVKAVKVARIATAGWTKVQRLLNIALIANPVGIVIAAIAVLAAAMVYAYQQSETFRNIINGAWRGAKELARILSERLSPALSKLGALLSDAFGRVSTFIQENETLQKVLSFLGDTISWLGDTAFDLLIITVEGAIVAMEGFFNLIKGLGNFLGDVFSGNWDKAAERIKSFGKDLINLVKNRLSVVFTGIQSFGRAISNVFSGDFSKAAEEASRGIQQITSGLLGVDEKSVAETAKRVGEAASKGYNSGVNAGSSVMDKIRSAALGSSPILSTADASAIQSAGGIVSGGRINTFNINIEQVTGINEVKTTNVRGSAMTAGDEVAKAILSALADIRPI